MPSATVRESHATEQWEENSAPPEVRAARPATTRVTLAVDGQPVAWLSNMRVYGWHRERFCSDALLTSALMALETLVLPLDSIGRAGLQRGPRLADNAAPDHNPMETDGMRRLA